MKSTMTTMLVSLTLIAATMGAALGIVHKLTAEPIAQAQAKAKAEALESVLPKVADCTVGAAQEITIPGETRPVILYPATADGKSVGAAVETWTMDGFSGEITVMVGFDASGAVSGFKVLQSAETPGLGSKAAEWFCDSTGHRSIIGSRQMLQVKKDGGDIDAITAATITSRAFLGAVNRARQAWQISQGEKPADAYTSASASASAAR